MLNNAYDHNPSRAGLGSNVRSGALAVASLLATTALAACSGGGSVGSPPVPGIALASLPAAATASQAARGNATVAITIAIPGATPKSGMQLKYVSSGTKSVAVSIAPVGTVAPAPSIVNCTTTCSISLSEPIGTDVFGITLYDASNGTGNRLAFGQTTQTIVANQTNTVRLSLGGVIASLAIANVPAFTAGTAASAPVTISALDAAGYTIVGSDAYTTPISVGTSDATNTFTLTSASLGTPSSTTTLNYSGGTGATSATISASVAGTNARATTPVVANAPAPAPSGVKFGAFARANGTPPFGMFTSSGSLDATKTQNLLTLGATWTRMSTSPFYVDQTVFGAGKYDFSNIDTLVKWQQSNHIEPVTGIEAGPVQVNATPGTFSPHEVARYATAGDFANYCTAIATHMKSLGEHTYSEPGNEVNTNPQLFPNGASDVAAYGSACYRAIKAVDASATVYGLELNMDGQAGATAFVTTLKSLGCGPGTCYDGISAHLSLRYPTPSVTTPCYPNSGGDYGVQCLADLRTASGSPVPIMVGETVTTWSGMVPDAATKALSDVASLHALAATGYVKYINYANVDECGLYPSGYFMNGCLIDVNNVPTPSWQPVIKVFHGA
ncbi:MAG: hypothetical protein NVS2B3_01470 [Vulcanimicrobiaceae bacterium]